MSTFDPAAHVGHRVDITESTEVYWYFETDVETKTLSLYDYRTGDGEGDYRFYCSTCQVSGDMPDDWDMDWI